MSPSPEGWGRRALPAALLALAPALLLPGILAAQPAPLQGLQAWIEEARAEWEVPGLSVAVVKDGETVWVQGFGVRELHGGEPVDEHTIFAIGSASKAFTSASIGMLVQEDLLDWDDRATRHLPWFETSDPYVTRELTVRDLLTHRSGLTRGDQIWYAMGVDREEILRRVRHQPPTSSFRSQFGYNNNMYLAAGQILPALTGLDWDAFVDRRIFAPLGMERSTTSTLPLAGMENVATPHGRIDDEVQPIPWRNIDNIAPAGSINSSAEEMARWVALQLAEGRWRGQALLDEAVVAEMHAAQTIIPLEGPWALMAPDSHFLMYGMGWFLHDYRGRKIVQHGGNIDGMHALVAMMPEEEAGVVVLTNLIPNHLTYAVMYRVFDAYLGAPETDWSTRLREMADEMNGSDQDPQPGMEESRLEGTSPSLALDAYAGTWRHAMYGAFRIEREGEGLVIRNGPSWVGDLEHWHLDTFRIDWRDPTMGRTFITFGVDTRGQVSSADLQGFGQLTRPDGPR